ncbi:MAG: alpha/beta hydrolase fold domain-containing protein [Rhizobiaceae bacterium]
MTDEIDYIKEYDNSARVENSAELLDTFITDAANFRETPELAVDYDVEYGPEPRNKMDIFWPDNKAGKSRKSRIVLFIHGGYWQMMDRSAFSHLAKGLNANGIAVAIPSYTLCPDISIDGIITEMRRACLVLYQTYKKKLTVVGHSAGGHLSACMMATNWEGMHSGLPHDLVASGMGISGLYDLLPLLQTPTNDAVGMDEEQAIESSPIRWIPEAIQRFEAWVGSEESNEYHRQSRDLAARWNLLGTPTNYVSDAGTNHFTIINALAHADSEMTLKIVELVKKPTQKVKLQKLNEEAVLAQMQVFEEEEQPVVLKKRKTKRVTKKPASKPPENGKPAPVKTASSKPKAPAKKRGISKKALAKHATRKTTAKIVEKPKPPAVKEQPKASIGGKAPVRAKAIQSKKKPQKPAQAQKTKATTKKKP